MPKHNLVKLLWNSAALCTKTMQGGLSHFLFLFKYLFIIFIFIGEADHIYGEEGETERKISYPLDHSLSGHNGGC